ncbi:MAG: fibronectin type III domain-containing protein [Actinomycetes bacterium]
MNGSGYSGRWSSTRTSGSKLAQLTRLGWPVLLGAVLTLVMAMLPMGVANAAVPTVTAISPTTGPIAGGTQVTITGSNFIRAGTNTVTFGGVAATSVTASSSTRITATVPAAAAAGAVNVVVTNSNGTGTLTNGYTYYSLTPFSCTSNMFQISNTGNGALWKYQSPTNTMVRVGSSASSGINAMGYNTADNFMYAVNSTTLYQIDANGVFTGKGTVTGVSSPTNGAFVSANQFLVGSGSSWDVVDVTTNVATVVTFGSSWSPADIAVYPSPITGGTSKGYGLSNASLQIVDLAALTGTRTVTTKTVTGVTTADTPTTGAYGAAYADNVGNLYFYNNTDGKVFEITQAEAAATSPKARYVGGVPVYSDGTTTTLTASNDGAYCPTAAAPYVLPTVRSDAATSVGSTSGTLNGTITPNGAITTAKFIYGTDSSLTTGTTTVTATGSPISLTNGATAVSYALTGLTSGRTYYYRAVGNNNFDPGTPGSSPDQMGAILSFTPTAPTAPTVSATTLGTPTNTSVTVSASVTPNGSLTTNFFDYSTDPAMTSYSSITATPATIAATSSAATINSTLAGLTSGQRYYVRARALNSLGSTSGAITTFVTGGLPTVATLAATSVGTTTATINGTVSPNGSSTDVSFKYGTDPTLVAGTTVTGVPSPVTAGSADNTSVSYGLTGLTQGTTYYFRVIATNSQGTTNGSILNFTYVSTAPAATTSAATSVGSTTATLNGTVNTSGNYSTTVTFTYGTSPTLSTGNTTVTAAESPVINNPAASVTASLSGLTVGTTYYFRVNAASSEGSASGTILSFTPTAAPTVSTGSVTSITGSTGTMNATITPNGLSTAATFKYGTDPTLVTGATVTAVGSPVSGSAGATNVTYGLTGLTAGTVYYFRAVGVNSQGTTSGDIHSFSTTSPPVVTTSAASSVGTTSATLNGVVDPKNLSTSVMFTYGPTLDLIADSVSVTADQSPISGSASATNVTYTLTGLSASTTYYFRVTATNSAGAPVSGTVLSFTTAYAPSNTVAPVLSGTPTAGSTLTTTTGTWIGSPTPEISYQWQSCTTSDCVGGTVTSIGTNVATYTVTGAEVGNYVRVKVTGTNTVGSADGYSNRLTLIPTVTSVSPSSGTATGGTSVTITGTNLYGATDAKFGGTSGTGLSVVSPTSVTATTPAHAGGAVTVDVTTVGGTGSKTSAYTFVNTPSAPSITGVTGSNGTLSVAFTAPVNNGGSVVTTYQYSVDGGISWVTREDGGSTGSPIVISGLTNGTQYSVTLRAVNANGGGASSAPATGTPAAVAASAPTITGITAGDAHMHVAFTPPTSDGGAAITTYQYSTDGGTSWLTRQTGTTDAPLVITALSTNGTTPLVNGTTYHVKIRAYTTVGGGAASNQVDGTPSTVPGIPSITGTTAGNALLNVAFTAPASDGGSTITGYEYSVNDGATWQSAGTSSPFTISGLNNGTSYTVQLRAVNANGPGAAASGTATAPHATAPGAATLSLVTHGDQTLTATFLPPSDNGGAAIAGYEYSTDGGTSWHARTDGGTTASPMTIQYLSTDGSTPLANGTPYSIKVRALNGSAYPGVASNAISETPSTVPTEPTSVEVTPGDSSLTLTFSAPTSNGGSAITGYVYSVNFGVSWVSVSGSPAVVAQLTNGTTYLVMLRATNDNGAGTAWGPTSYTPFTAPSAPILQTVNPGDQRLTAAFTAPSSDGGSAITTYQYSTDGGVTWHARTDGGTTSTTMTIAYLSTNGTTQLTNGTSYPIKVRAVNSISGAVSNTVSGAPSTTPGAPTITKIDAGDDTLTVSFTAPASTGGAAITDYEYQIKVDGGSYGAWTSIGKTSSPFVIGGLTDFQKYWVQLRAVNPNGGGTASDAVEGTPIAVASQPPLWSTSSPDPLVPGNVRLTANFSRPSDSGGEPIVRYEYTTDAEAHWVDGSVANPNDSGAHQIVITTQSSVGNPALANGTAYTVKVRAVTQVPENGQLQAYQINGLPSEPRTATPSTTPGVPTLGTATEGNVSLTVPFTAPASNGGSAITTYEYSTDGGTSWHGRTDSGGPNPDSPMVIQYLSTDGTTPLVNDVAYSVTIRAVNVNGHGDAPTPVSLTPNDGVPETPSLDSLGHGNTTLTAVITQPPGTPAPQTYEYSTDGGTTWHVRTDGGTTGTTITIAYLSGDGTTALANGTGYDIRIRGKATGVSAASNMLIGTPSTTPGAPTITTPIVGGDDTLTVSFTAPASTGGAAITDYEYQIKVDGGSYGAWTSIGKTSSPFVIGGLTDFQKYWVQLRAVNTNGGGTASTEAEGTPIAVPSEAPVWSVASPAPLVPGNKTLTANFSRPGDSGGEPIVRYEYTTDNEAHWVDGSVSNPNDPGAHQIVITKQSTDGTSDLVNGTPYTVKLRAVTYTGSAYINGTVSADKSATPATTPSAPTMGTVTHGNVQLSVAFTPGDNGGSAITGYEYSTDNGSTWLARQTGTTGSPLVITKLSTNGITPLSNGTTYQIKIRALNAMGTGTAPADPVSGTPSTWPSAPTIGTIVEGDEQLTVPYSLGSNGGAEVTSVQYSVDDGASWLTADPVLANPIVITGVLDGTTYLVRVRGVNLNGTGDASDAVEATPWAPAPNAPTDVVITPSNARLSVAFTPGDSHGEPIVNYEYSTDDGGHWLPRNDVGSPSANIPIVIAYKSTGTGTSPLVNGTEYKISIRAVNEHAQVGAASVSVAATPSATPLAPTLGDIVAGDDQLTVPFMAGSNGGSAVTKYQYSVDDGASWVDATPTVTSNPIVITGLTDNVEYTVRVRAVNINGAGAASASQKATPIPMPPDPPTLQSLTPGNATLTAIFVPGDDGGSEIESYQYTTDTMCGDACRWLTATTTGPDNLKTMVMTTQSDGTTALANGMPYTVRIRAVNVDGVSIPSNDLTATPSTVPQAPTSLSVTAGNAQLTLNFTSPVSDGGSALTGYQYSLDDGASWVSVAVPQTNQIVITGLTNGQEYILELRAVNANGAGPANDTDPHGTPSTTPSAPTLGTVSHGDGTLSVAFTAGSDGGAALSNYEYKLDGGTWTARSPASTTSPLEFSGLTNGHEYTVQMRAVNANGQGIASNIVTGTPSKVASAPTITDITPDDSSLIVGGIPPSSDGGSAITNFEYSTDDGAHWTAWSPPVLTSPQVITGLTNGTEYTVRVRALNANGAGAASNAVTGTPQIPAPGKPGTPTAVGGDGRAAVNVNPGTVGGDPTSWTVTASPGGATCTITGYTGACDVTGLTNGTQYTFTAVAHNAGGDSETSDASNAVTPMGNQVLTFDKTPVINSVGGSDTTHAVSNASGAVITYSSANTDVCTVSGSLVTGVAVGVCVIYADAAATSAYNAAPQIQQSFSIGAEAPHAPTAVLTTIPSPWTSAQVSWTAPTETHGLPITGYVVTSSSTKDGTYVPATGGCAVSITGTKSATTCTMTGLTVLAQYWYKVAAVTGAGQGPVSAASDTVPTAVQNVALSLVNGKIRVNWDPPTSDGSGGTGSEAPILYYRAYSFQNGVVKTYCQAPLGTNTCDLPNLLDNTDYTVRIKAMNKVSTNGGAMTDPAGPITVHATSVSSVSPGSGSTGGNTLVTISGAHFYTGATVAFNGVPATSVSVVNQSTITARTPAGTAGYATVTVASDLGTFTKARGYIYVQPPVGAQAQVQSLSPDAAAPSTSAPVSPSPTAPVSTAPMAPAVPTSTAVGDRSADLKWVAPADGGSAITGYDVQVATTAGGPYADAAGCTALGDVLSCTATGLDNGTAYYFKVRARNAVGAGEYSAAGGPFTPVATTCAQGGVCAVGDIGPGGGIVFYVAPSLQPWGRYLEAAPKTWNGGKEDPSMIWCDASTDVSTKTDIGSGAANTDHLVAACTLGAAVDIHAYKGGGKHDWYLPSKDELAKLFLDRAAVGGFGDGQYWSSSESAGTDAWYQAFPDGAWSAGGRDVPRLVRPIRAF